MLRFTISIAWAALTLLAVPPVSLHADDLVEKYRASAIQKWSKDMERIAALDAKEKDPDDAVLFIGSSSIRLWEDIASDMKPWPAVQRGYGGAKFSDLAVLAEQIIKPHKYRALAIFVGNDVTGGADDKTPEEVVRLFEHVVATARHHDPKAPIFLIEVTPTPRRWAAWDKIKDVNAALKKACQSGENLHFISTASHYLDSDGQPKAELFREDRLHQNRDGYALWSRLIREEFAKVIPVDKP
ncbi:MAG: GDSL-type esterase/lipase family protein [Aureliella sp.]